MFKVRPLLEIPVLSDPNFTNGRKLYFYVYFFFIIFPPFFHCFFFFIVICIILSTSTFSLRDSNEIPMIEAILNSSVTKSETEKCSCNQCPTDQ